MLQCKWDHKLTEGKEEGEGKESLQPDKLLDGSKGEALVQKWKRKTRW